MKHLTLSTNSINQDFFLKDLSYDCFDNYAVSQYNGFEEMLNSHLEYKESKYMHIIYTFISSNYETLCRQFCSFKSLNGNHNLSENYDPSSLDTDISIDASNNSLHNHAISLSLLGSRIIAYPSTYLWIKSYYIEYNLLILVDNKGYTVWKSHRSVSELLWNIAMSSATEVEYRQNLLSNKKKKSKFKLSQILSHKFVMMSYWIVFNLRYYALILTEKQALQQFNYLQKIIKIIFFEIPNLDTLTSFVVSSETSDSKLNDNESVLKSIYVVLDSTLYNVYFTTSMFIKAIFDCIMYISQLFYFAVIFDVTDFAEYN